MSAFHPVIDDVILQIHYNDICQRLSCWPSLTIYNVVFFSSILYVSFHFYATNSIIISAFLAVPLIFYISISIIYLLLYRSFAYISCLMKHNHHLLRYVVGFLQQAELGADYFSVKGSNQSLYPDMLKGVLKSTNFYTTTLLNLSLNVEKHEFTCCLSQNQLQTLKVQISLPSNEGDFSTTKMQREIFSLLETDMIQKCCGILCCLHPLSLKKWFHFLIILWSWERYLIEFQRQLTHLDSVRKLLLERKPLALETPISTNQDTTRSLMDELIVRLTICLRSAHDLCGLSCKQDKMNGEQAVFNEAEAILLFKHIQRQLLVCSNHTDVLRATVCPSTNESCTKTCEVLQEDILPSSSVLEVGSVMITQLKAEDLNPEDDVLIETAVGSDLPDTTEASDDPGDLVSLRPVATLHPSVLKELTVAITSRRAQMRAREREALRRRGYPESASSDRSSDEDVKVCSEERLKADSAEQPDLCLREFFSSPTVKRGDSAGQSMVQPISAGVFDDHSAPQVTHQCRLRLRDTVDIRKAVDKRSQSFRTSLLGVHSHADRNPAKAGNDREERHVLADGIPPPTVRYPSVNRFISPTVLASALLEERRRKGYAEMEVFTDHGDGDGD